MNRERTERIINMARDRSEDVVRLAMFTSIAVSISPALLRALRYRLLPGRDAGVESDFWFSNLVATRNALAVTLNADVAEVLRDMLKASQLLDAARNVIAEVHAGAPHTLQVEEEILWRGLRDAPGDASEVETLLQRAVKTMIDAPHRANDIARWADRALQRFAVGAHVPDAARLLATGAYLRIGAQARMAGQHDRMQLPPAPQWLAPSGGTTIVTLGVRLLEVGLEFVALGTTGSGTIVVPDDELRLVQLEWTGPSGDETSIAQARVGSTAAIPAYVGSLKLRTMNGAVYRIEATTGSEESGSSAVPPADDGSGAAVDRYRVAKVLIVGANSAAKAALFAELTGQSRGDTPPTPQSWRAPVDDDGVTRELVFWQVPDEPVWLGALSAEYAAAVIVVDPADSPAMPDPWITPVRSWLASNPMQPQLFLARVSVGGGGIESFVRLAGVMRDRWAESLDQPVHVSFVNTADRASIETLRSQLMAQIAWREQLAFNAVDQFDRIEGAWRATIASLIVAPHSVLLEALTALYEGPRETDWATVRAEHIAGLRGTIRPLDWPQVDVTQRPYRSVERHMFDERVSAIVAKLTSPESQKPFVFVTASSTKEGEVDELVANEFVRLGIGFQHATKDGKWLVVPEVAGIQRAPGAAKVRYHQFRTEGAGDAQTLWFRMLLELQERNCRLKEVGKYYASIDLQFDSSEMTHRVNVTLDAEDQAIVSAWRDHRHSQEVTLQFVSVVEESIRACLPEGGRVFDEDIFAANVTRITVQLSVAPGDRGRPFTRFANTLRAMLPRNPTEIISLISEKDDSVYEGADLFVAIFSQSFASSEKCRSDLKLAADDESLGRTVIAPFIWTPLIPVSDASLLNRYQPFDLVQETGRSLFELCERGTDDELKKGLANYIALIHQRLNDRTWPIGGEKREEPRAEYEIVPNVSTHDRATQLLAANLMQKLALVFHVGSLHPSESVEQTEYYKSSAKEVQEDLVHARFVSEYIYAQEATTPLQGGEDPFTPTIDEVRAQYSEAITLALGPRLEMAGIITILEALREESRYLTNARQALEGALHQPIDKAIDNASASTASLMREQPFIAVARDLLSRSRQAFLRFPTSMSECPDFAAYIERLSATIQRYAEWAASRYPDARPYLYGTFPNDVTNVLPALVVESDKDNRGVSISVRDYPLAIQQTSAILVAALRQSLADPRSAKSVQ